MRAFFKAPTKPRGASPVFSPLRQTGLLPEAPPIPPMKLSKLAVCAALVAAFSMPFTAQAAKGDRKNKKAAAPAFSTLDKNSDGSITKEEYVAAMKDSIGEETANTQFASMDKNSDGKLSSEEYSASSGKKGKGKKKKNN
jgi:hypothetical protein